MFDDSDAVELTADTIDDCPFGVIMIDRQGIVRGYNAAESALARRSKERTIGKHFFKEIAPCTSVRAFEGAFKDFLAGDLAVGPRFRFTFLFPWGAADVVVRFVRIPTFDGGVVLVEPPVAKR